MNKELLNQIADRNTREYNLHKAAEELQELALVLNQYLLKPQKVDEQEIIDEIGDVKMRLYILQQMFPKEKIKKRIKEKSEKYEEYIKNNTFKNI
jgi:hypothetical protein